MPMASISETLGEEHRRCDDLFTAAEGAVDAGAWEEAAARLAAFREALEAHLTLEEERLFPALEAAEPHAQGPTAVMRQEHRHMRALAEELGQALAARDRERYLGAAETLLVLMQQHNAKEEHVLYPMSDRLLGPETLGAPPGEGDA